MPVITTDVVLAIGVMITAGLLAGLLAKRLKFPMITGYILVGMLLSPSVLGLVSRSTVEQMDIFTTFALSIIAYMIGGSLLMESIRRLAKSIGWITIGEVMGAWGLATLILLFMAPRVIPIPHATLSGYYLPLALVIGSIAGATAPAATVAVIREYKASGPFTTTLLSVVAIDDAVSVVTFAIAIAIAQPLLQGTSVASPYQMFAVPLIEILKSIGVGAAFGFILINLIKLAKSRSLLLVAVLGSIILCAGVADFLDVSYILACMVLGFVVRNRVSEDTPFIVVEHIEYVVYAAFFVLTGMHFDSSVLRTAGMIGLLIIAGRFGGQCGGAWLGARVSGAPDSVRKYLGLSLQAQAGVTVGLALLAGKFLPGMGELITNSYLASVIVNEIYAPPLVRYSLFKAGEAEEIAKPASSPERGES